MKIITEQNTRWLTVEDENNSLYDIEQNTVLGKRLIPAKSINENNVKQYFRELTPDEAEEINKACTDFPTEA